MLKQGFAALIYPLSMNGHFLIFDDNFSLHPNHFGTEPWEHFSDLCWLCVQTHEPHLNRDKIESNLSVPEIQGRHENTLTQLF